MEKARVLQAKQRNKPQTKLFQAKSEVELEQQINAFIDENWDDEEPINHIGWTTVAQGDDLIYSAMIIYRPKK
jgi:hypothetical protein